MRKIYEVEWEKNGHIYRRNRWATEVKISVENDNYYQSLTLLSTFLPRLIITQLIKKYPAV